MIIGVASADYLRPTRSVSGQEQWGGAGWARVGQWVPYWERMGHEVIVGTLWKQKDRVTVAIDHDEKGNRTHYEPDVVILQRIMHDGVAEAIRLAQSAGQYVINDVDDWYWGLDPRNMAWKASHPKFNEEENRSHYKKNVLASDMIICSTPWLQDQFVKQHDNVIVVKNYVDVARFPRRRDRFDDPNITPWVGWVGSTDHRSGDLAQLSTSLPMLQRQGLIQVYHGGHLDFEGSKSFADEIGMDPELVYVEPRTDAHGYPKLLAMPHIGLVPLADKPFNYAKSDIKGLEYAAAGIPFVASPSPAYVDLAKAWDIGVELVGPRGRGREWTKGIKKLLDYQYRQDAAEYLENAVLLERDIAVGANMWDLVLDSVDAHR